MKYLLRCLVGILAATIIVVSIRWIFINILSVTEIPKMITYTILGVTIIIIGCATLYGVYLLGDGIIELIKSCKKWILKIL